MGSRYTTVLLAAFTAAALASCDSDGSGTAPKNLAPAISLGVNPQSSSVPQGGSGQIMATIAKTNFAGAVTLTVSGAPTTILISISQPPITGAIATGLIAFTASPTTAPATYNLTIQASGSGVPSVSTTFALTVTAVGSYILSSSSSGIAIAAGASGTVPLSITRDNFASLIDLAVTNPPNGVTSAFAPNPVVANTSTLTLTVAAGTALGTHSLSVRATSAGSPPQTLPLILTVGALTTFTFSVSATPVSLPQGGSRSVTISLTRGAAFTAAVALAVEGAATGLTATLDPASVSGTSSTLTLTAAANLAVRTYM
ncbi:MAG: hypothetical protein ACRD2A_16030, partial [Vicinamibacterales bacterium]